MSLESGSSWMVWSVRIKAMRPLTVFSSIADLPALRSADQVVVSIFHYSIAKDKGRAAGDLLVDLTALHMPGEILVVKLKDCQEVVDCLNSHLWQLVLGADIPLSRADL